MTRLLLALGIALALAAPAQAQTGSLSGTIVDESGAVIPGATVTLAGPIRASTVSGPRGEYSFRNLPEGTYQLTISLVGFSQATIPNLNVGRSVYLDFFGLVLWDFLPTNLLDIKQIEVIRGPASAVWGANAFTGVVNVLTKTPREAPGATVTLSAGLFSRDCSRCSTNGKG